MTTKNDFIFSCITGLSVPGRESGAENEGWRDTPSWSSVNGFYDAMTRGDLGCIANDFSQCVCEFDPAYVVTMLDVAKDWIRLDITWTHDELIEFVNRCFASDRDSA